MVRAIALALGAAPALSQAQVTGAAAPPGSRPVVRTEATPPPPASPAGAPTASVPAPSVPVPAPPVPEPPLPDDDVVRPRVITGAPLASPPAARAPIEVQPLPPAGGPAREPRFINLRRDTTGLLPRRPPGPPTPRPAGEVAQDVDGLFERVQEPEAELSVVVGHTKLLETKKPLVRIAVANPQVADVELLNDQADARSLNLYGRSFGNTTITFWETDDKPVTFLVRVTLDTLDLEGRIKQTFPGAVVHVRQVGPQVILEGQVSDSKTMAEVVQLVTAELRNSFGMRMGGGMGGGGMGGGGMGGGGMGGGMGGGGMGGGGMGGGGMGGGMGGGGMGGGGMAIGGAAGGGSPYYIINRIQVPGPRQVMLHVKIAELNRTAIRELGISWLDPKNQAILGSTIGGAANIIGNAGAPAPISQTAVTSARGVLQPLTSTFGSGATATNANAQLFGIFNAAQFSLFLNALRSNALAKLLAEPNLMALDGQPARFLAGGLFPYPVPQSSSIPGGTAVVTVQFANFGAILSFLPNILANDEIQLDVEPVFSQLNFGAGTTINGGRVPAIDQRSARTVVRLREGQTLAIAGLLQTTTNATTVRVPILGDIPIVGPWFSSNRVETVETELVVLVTPELVAPLEAQQVPPAPGDRVYQPNDYEFYFLGRIEGKLGREFRATVRELDPLNVMKHIASENRWVVGPHGYAD